MATRAYTYINGTTIDANQNNPNEDELYSNIDSSNVQPANKLGTGRFVLETYVSSFPSLVPIGSIIPFYDFNAALTFDVAYWAYCDGSVANISGIGAQTLPDLSGRYLVGFGTDGGGDNDSAAWATAAIGNASHQINLQHSHTVNAHTHSIPSHYHGKGTLAISASGSHFHTVGVTDGAAAGAPFVNADDGGDAAPDGNINSSSETHTHSNSDFTGSVGNTGGVNGDSAMTSGSSSPGTDNQLSTTQSIQPRSIRVRYIMRIQ